MNRIPLEVKEMVRRALDEEGGVEYLRQVAREHPQAFLSLLGRLIPAEFKGEISARPLVRITDYTGVKWRRDSPSQTGPPYGA